MANATIPYEDRILRRHNERWDCAGTPHAWAQHRVDMTDAMTWFKSTQSGVWSSSIKNPPAYVLGMLMAGHTGERTYVDAEVIITSINGNQGNTPSSLETGRRRDAMTSTISAGRLVGMIFENGATQSSKRTRDDGSNADLPAVLPCRNMPTGEHQQNCWVAAYFLPTFMWPVKIPGKQGAVWMVRLEKYDLEQQSWWANADHGLPPPNHQRSFNIRPTRELCATCNLESPRIFQEMFICLHDTCANVWQHNGQIIPQDTTLTYTAEFLKERKSRPLAADIFPSGHSQLVQDFNAWWNMKYNGPMTRNDPVTIETFKERMNDLLVGFCCPHCHMLNRRIRWHEWHCRNSRCNDGRGSAFTRTGIPPTITIQQATTFRDGPATVVDLTQSPYYRRRNDQLDFEVFEFEFGSECKAAYLRPKPHTNALPGSSDYLFQKIQDQAKTAIIPLERRRMNPVKAGPMLTSHFAANYGPRYFFGANVPTTPMNAAPQTIQDAMTLVNGWTAPWRQANDDPANELYLAGYWEGQKMNWHNDGEKGLQDIITTYTLGGSGRFHFRINTKINSGFTGPSKRTVIEHDPVIPGCTKEAQRRILRQQLDSGQINQAQWKLAFATLMRADKTINRSILSIPVNHGEMVIMYGPMTQRYLEHCVEVATPMRFALTFRNITSDHIDAEHEAELEGKIAYDIAFDPGRDWGRPHFLDPVGSREGSVGEPLPARSPRDKADPPPKKRNLGREDAGDGKDDDDDGDHDGDNNDDDGAEERAETPTPLGIRRSGRVAAGPETRPEPGPKPGQGRERGRGRGQPASATAVQEDVEMGGMGQSSALPGTPKGASKSKSKGITKSAKPSSRKVKK